VGPAHLTMPASHCHCTTTSSHRSSHFVNVCDQHGCAGDRDSALYCHVKVLRSIVSQENYMENFVPAARPAHAAVMSRPGLYLVEGKTAIS